MSEIKFSSLRHKEQIKIKPKPPIEDIIHELFDDSENKQVLLDFIVHLRENKMNPLWTLHNTWKANVKGKTIFYIGLFQNSWRIDLFLHNKNNYDDVIVNEELQYVFWDRIVFLPNSIHTCIKCLPGKNVTLYGKDFENVCGCMSKFIRNPNDKTIAGIKRLLDLEKNARTTN